MPALNGRRKPVFRNQAVSLIIVRTKHNGKKLYFTGHEGHEQKFTWDPHIENAFHFLTMDAVEASIDQDNLLRKISPTDRLVVAQVYLTNVKTYNRAPPKYRRKKAKKEA